MNNRRINSEQKCQASKKNGKACSNKPWGGGRFCYVHSINYRSRLNWYSNPKVHIVIAIFGIITSIFIWLNGPTKENQEIISSQNTETLKNQIDIKKSIDTLKYMMEVIERRRKSEFIEHYIYGYQLYAYNKYGGGIIPSESRLRFDYKVDWDVAELKEGRDSITIKLPNVFQLPQPGHRFHENTIGTSKYYLGYLFGSNIGSIRI